MGCHQQQQQKTFRPLPDNLGSWFSVYNLILTQLDEIWREKKYWGAINQKSKNCGAIKKNIKK